MKETVVSIFISTPNMSDTIIGCGSDLSNHFTKSQYNLSDIFEAIEGVDGVWQSGMIPDGGRFPVNSGFAARVTTIAQQRLGIDDINLWQAMDASLSDCAATCSPPTAIVDFGNAQHNWYRLMNIAYNTKPYCLTQLYANHLNAPEQIAQVYKDLKFISMDVMDEFNRNNYVGLSAYRWMGYDPAGGTPALLQQQWRFATDANGFIDTKYIILAPTVNPNYIAMLSTDELNQIRNRGIPIGTFPVDGEIPLMTDYQAFSDMPLYDTNRRQDNRFRAPVVLNPEYKATTSYAGYNLKNDFFALRYFWTTTEPGYPNGVLKRVFQWSNQAMSEGCWSNVNESYETADFQLNIPFSEMHEVFRLQSGETPLSAGSGTNFQALASPWNGTWRWINEINEYTPCNQDRDIGYWRMNLRKAARPVQFGTRGHVLLTRRNPIRGITRNCQTLGAPTSSYASCNTCPPVDFYPPPLVDRWTCGGFNASGVCAPV